MLTQDVLYANEYFFTWSSGVFSVTMSGAVVIGETGKGCTSATVTDEASGADETVFCCCIGVEFTCF